MPLDLSFFSWFPEDPNEEEIQNMALTMKDAKVRGTPFESLIGCIMFSY